MQNHFMHICIEYTLIKFLFWSCFHRPRCLYPKDDLATLGECATPSSGPNMNPSKTWLTTK